VLTGIDRSTVSKIHEVKTDLLLLRRAVWPHRETFNELIRDPTTLVSSDTRVYLRDCYDHTVQIIDLLEMYRELGSDLRDLYLSAVSNRMNEIMKVLTIITTIFMPLSFIAGIYGMNFNTEISPWNMPELNWRWGYPVTLAVMALLAAGMVAFFVKRGWLGFADTPRQPRGVQNDD
jgi:magnesium transporter